MSTSTIISKFSDALTDMNLSFSVAPTNDSIHLGIHNSGDIELPFDSLELIISVYDDVFTFDLFPRGFKVIKSAYDSVAKLISLINSYLIVGHFRFVGSSNILSFRYSQFVGEDAEELEPSLVDNLISVCMGAWAGYANSLIPTMLGYTADPVQAFKFSQDLIKSYQRENDDDLHEDDS